MVTSQLKGIEMTKWILGLTVAVVLVCSCAALAAPLPRTDASSNVLQQAEIKATGEVEQWESRPFAGTVYVNLRDPSGRLLAQTGISSDGCGGTYVGHGALVHVRLLRCNLSGANPVRFRFVSLAGPQHLRVVISGRQLVG
jgi:hypothetical protein